MKKSTLLICIILSILTQFNYAQSSNTNDHKTKLTALYLNIGITATSLNFTGAGGVIGANFILSNNWGGSISISGLQREAKELPSNYTPGNFLGVNGAKPFDKMKAYSFRIVREFPGKTKKFRFGLEGGLSLVEHTTAYFTFKGVSNIIFARSSNYNTSYSTTNTLGASFKAKLEFPLGRWVGFELAAITDINSYQSYVGGEVNLIVGLVRGK